ncbi:MAG: photosynthetic complex assembly protein PuhC [Betaproteobacteria bacterium]|nr:photosynthetic complex assembly protein PuhC [Rubrivivax sp.]
MNPGSVHASPERIPRWLVRGIGALLLTVLVSVGLIRLNGFSPAVQPASALASRTLAFADAPDGAVRVSDAASGEVLAELRGEQGFLRGVLRGLARDRRAHQLGGDAPYVLSLHADGRLLITDPHTGQRIDLASFGPDNAAVFARWLPAGALQSLKTQEKPT